MAAIVKTGLCRNMWRECFKSLRKASNGRLLIEGLDGKEE